jgi:hypothetical protein
MKCRVASSLVPVALLLALLSVGCQTRKSTLIPYRDFLGDGGVGWHDDVHSVAETPADRAVREVLEHRLKNLTANQMPFEKVMNFCRDEANVNIFVNWTALQFLDIDRNTPVTLKLRERTLAETLTAILDQIGGESHPLGYIIDDGVITVSTKEDLQSAKYQVVRVFDIRDMLVLPSDSQQEAELEPKSSFLFRKVDTPSFSARDELVWEIFQVIRTTVDPKSWHDAGGRSALSAS